MARGRINTETAIIWGAAGLGAYVFWKHRQAIASGAASRGLSMVRQDPKGAVDASMLAYQLGLRPSEYVAGFDGYGACEQCAPTYEGYGEWNAINDHQWGDFGAFNKNSTLKEIRVARKDIKSGKKDLKKVKDVHKQIRHWTRPGLFRGGKGKGVLARTMIPFKKKIRKAEAKAWRKVRNLDRQLSSADQKLATIQSQLRMIPSGLGGFDGYGKLPIGDYAQEAGPAKVALVVATLAAPFTVYPWLLKKWKPNLGYGTRVLLSIGGGWALSGVFRSVRRAIINRDSGA